MLQSRIKSAFIGAAVSVAAVFGSVGSAQAAVYAGAWDPVFGPAFPDLGWKGSATYFVPDACLGGSGWIDNTSACSGDSMKILSAQVDLYSVSAGPSTILETLTFDPLALPAFYVYSMEITGGQLSGVSSGYSAPVKAYSSLAGGGAYYFDLAFLEGGPGGVGKGAKLFYSTSKNPICSSTATNCGASLDADPSTGGGVVHYALVPEPETYALMLAGLGAVGFMARRRRL
jgi:PEP-CTERM motif